MKKMNPIEQSRFIENEFRNYIKSTFILEDSTYSEQFNTELDGTDLYKGPFISTNLPFHLGHSINELIETGKISSQFKKFDDLDFDRPLYYHQESAFNKIANGRNVVISTGTGSGKTESFLYPILNSIVREIESGNTEAGIRALFLYPMNALVNDQIDRVRKILCNYPDIKYGFFTGELDEHSNAYTREKLSRINGCEIPENELVSRDEIRKNPPHLLFTNYSMLEYLLIRPNDFNVLSSDSMKYWKYIVLDEAHTYQGALGIEVAMLMRRVTGLVSIKPQFILTSATLGDEKNDIDKIISFAESLTSVHFNEEDIVFAKRIPLNNSLIKYTIDPVDYPIILENIDNLNALKSIAAKYDNFNYYNSIDELIYELLKKDNNVYELYSILSGDTIKDFSYVISELYNFQEEKELVDFIQLISKTNYNDKSFFSSRYHTFIRSLDGAFITLGNNKKLKLSNHKKIDGDIAFETGICKYCKTMYIMGKIIDNKLFQNDDVDIYENYGDIEYINLDYFLIKEQVEKRDIDFSKLEEWVVCKKCGTIHMQSNINAFKCGCEEDDKISLFRVKKEESELKNNLSECPCCGRGARGKGVVEGFHLGKDQSTAVISQILYKAIDVRGNSVESNDEETFTLVSDFDNEPIIHNKQFIAFSDSRQQASFFADFFSYNHERFLRKKLIWNELEEHDHNPIGLSSMARMFETILVDNNLFDSELPERSQSWITILSELLKIDGDYSGEGLGLFLCKLDMSIIQNKFKESDFKQYFGKYNISYEQFFIYLSVIFDIFRTVPAINYDKSQLTLDEKEQYLGYRRFNNYIIFKKDPKVKGKEKTKDNNNIRSFIPIKENGRNHVLNYTMRTFGIENREAINVLGLVFDLGRKLLFNENINISPIAYQINADHYKIHSYKEFKWFQCNKCGKVTIYNLHNACVKPGCNGNLSECNVDEIFKNNYYRNEYINKKIEKIVVKEHTAQLSKVKGKQYQRDFKNKIINILSCSTTFEMGVDIGSLETVFLRNVPPTPANYVQRAGRAGRRNDSNAFVLTFCGHSSHDYTYFNDPTRMIAGHILPPKFKITNEKIILRHILAASFGFYFRLNEDSYKNLGNLVLNGGIDNFINYLESKPLDLGDYIDNKLLDEDTYNLYSNFKWLELVRKNDGNLEVFRFAILDKFKELNDSLEQASAEKRYSDANYFEGQISKLKSSNVISSLSEYTVIPKYGFPIDVVNLNIYDSSGMLDEYDLSRDLTVAISEYAPESEIIVDGKKYTSRYIIKPRSGDLTKYYYFECDYCEHINVGIDYYSMKECEKCNHINENTNQDYFVIPIYGFITDNKNKETKDKKPKRSYASDIKYLGNGVSNDDKIDINHFISIESARNDQLLVLNENPFYMCPVCGYTTIDKKARGTSINLEHKRVTGHTCGSKILHRISLGHMFKTDVVKISIKQQYSKEEMLSLLFAILEGISSAYDIERRDINGVLYKNSHGEYDLIIYDNVPGGAGHVKRILNKENILKVFTTAYNKMNLNCCDENSSCYNCIRNYNNQRVHHILKRKYAKDILKYILDFKQ